MYFLGNWQLELNLLSILREACHGLLFHVQYLSEIILEGTELNYEGI